MSSSAPALQTQPGSGRAPCDQLDLAAPNIGFVAEAAPRGPDSHHDVSSALDQIEGRIEQIEHEIVALAPLVHERARLLRARAAILGEPEPILHARCLGPHVKREDVFRYLARNPGSRPGEIAAGLGVGQQVVSAHLYRGKGRLFTSRAGRWYPVPEADRGSP